MAVARNIDVGLLRTLVAVAQHGSMTAAGQALNLTQAAISQQVKRLEQLMNAPLIERDRKRLRLTSAGERLLSRARRMIAMNDEIYGLMTQPEHEGKIRLGVPCDVVHPFLPPILRNFTRTYPLIEVSIRSGNTYSLLSDVEAGNLDLTLTTETAPCPENGPLFIDQLVWVGAHRGQACRLDVVPLAFVGPNCAFRKSSIEALDAIGRDWL
ncbi:MAG: LysR family transcriptional regulator, partial [Pseudomonadota bacterium]